MAEHTQGLYDGGAVKLHQVELFELLITMILSA